MPETTPAAFKPTRWSLVIQSQGQDEKAKRALEELCAAYWFPLYAWSRRCGASPSDAEDYVQGFFVQVLQKQLFAAANPELGKLRTFMLTAFRRHVNDEQRKESRQKRGGGQIVSFDAAEAEAWYEVEQIEGESADHLFDRQWALTVLDLGNNCLGDLKGYLRPFGRGLSSNKTQIQLDLQNNRRLPAGIKVVCTALRTCTAPTPIAARSSSTPPYV
jgi:DNA-directed RNA polymerase specialized sigma24 family protein